MASDSRESSHATSPLLGLACMGHSCLQRAGSGWACRVSERLLPNANVGGGVAESGGWCPPPHIRRAHAARAPLCPPGARSMSTQLLCVFPAGPGCERARLMRAGLDGGAQGTWACGRWGHRCSPAERGPSVLVFAFFLRANLPRAVALGGGRGSTALRVERLPAPAHSANSVAERPSRWAWLSRGVFRPLQKASANPYFNHTTFPPLFFLLSRSTHSGPGAVLGVHDWPLDGAGARLGARWRFRPCAKSVGKPLF